MPETPECRAAEALRRGNVQGKVAMDETGKLLWIKIKDARVGKGGQG